MVPEAGLEPALCCQNGILNPACLPIPPLRHICSAHFIGNRVWLTAVQALIGEDFFKGFNGDVCVDTSCDIRISVSPDSGVFDTFKLSDDQAATETSFTRVFAVYCRVALDEDLRKAYLGR